MNVYCIVVTFNGSQWIDKCLKSLQHTDYPIATIVIDNGSSDGTVLLIKSKYPQVEVIEPEENLGFGKGNNVGIKRALELGADFVFLLNQDAYLLNGSIKSLLEGFGRNPKAGLISPIHLAGDERNLDFGFYKYADPKDTPFFLGELLKGEGGTEYETKYVNAAAWMLKAKMVQEIGMFHPIFDHYGEDREYVSRMAKAGYKTMICTLCCIVHDRPQGRAGNTYHRYGQNVTRDLLQGLIEKEITYGNASYKLFKLFVRNLISLQLKKAVLVFKGWLWMSKKNQLL